VAELVKVELVEIVDRRTLEDLVQLYSYDFTEFIDIDVGPDGRYDFIDVDGTFDKPTHHACFICVDNALAGFALAYEDAAFRDPSRRTWWMAEFFVLRAYRRKGVGRHAATMLFDRLGGTWEIGQIPANEPAQAFWRSVIGSYTGGDFEEFYVDDERWTGPVQCFDARTSRSADAG
jgi:predicted acetyltransferase